MSATHADITWGSLTVKQIASMSYSPDVSVTQDRATGAVAVSAVHVKSARPKVQITSGDLETILGVVDFATKGLYVSAGTISLPFNVRASGAAYASGSSHIKLAATHGLLIPVSATAEQDSDASLTLDGTIISEDGTTAPVTYAGSQSITSGSFNATYRLGPVTFGGVSVPGVVGATINFGITVDTPEITDGKSYPTAVYLTQVNPTIELRFRNQETLTTMGPLFKAMTAAVVSFQKQAPGSTVTGDVIQFTFADGTAHPQSFGGQGVGVSEASIVLTGETLTVSTP